MKKSSYEVVVFSDFNNVFSVSPPMPKRLAWEDAKLNMAFHPSWVNVQVHRLNKRGDKTVVWRGTGMM